MKIDVYHDTACPWCRIGKAHMKMALAAWQGEPVEIEYHTFFLNPAIPPEGHRFREYMHAKGGGQVPLEGWFDRPRQMGAQVGITFNFEKIEHAPNTLLSHVLINLAPEDKREQLIDAVYAAYFEHGRNIGDVDELIAIGAENGLTVTKDQLRDPAQRDAVLADAQRATQVGVTGVPFFVINNRYAFSGAQPPEVFTQVMDQITKELAG